MHYTHVRYMIRRNSEAADLLKFFELRKSLECFGSPKQFGSLWAMMPIGIFESLKRRFCWTTIFCPNTSTARAAIWKDRKAMGLHWKNFRILRLFLGVRKMVESEVVNQKICALIMTALGEYQMRFELEQETAEVGRLSERGREINLPPTSDCNIFTDSPNIVTQLSISIKVIYCSWFGGTLQMFHWNCFSPNLPTKKNRKRTLLFSQSLLSSSLRPYSLFVQT